LRKYFPNPSTDPRLYYDLADDHPLMKELCELACADPNLDLCHVRRIPTFGDISKVFPMNWRFVPLLDPQVSIDIFFSKGPTTVSWDHSDK
jgi:hypothetical protein